MKRKQASEEVAAPATRFNPSDEWLAAFRSQFYATLIALSVDYANELTTGIGSDTPKDKRYPRSVVLRALADTHVGVLRWDHTTPLKPYIAEAIRTRWQLDWNRARRRPERRYRHLYIEDRTASGRSLALEEADRLNFERLTEREKANEGLDELRARAVDDPELRAYIDARCYEGARADVLRQMNLSPEQYRQVARRLGQLIKQLSIEVRPRRETEEGKP